MGGKRPRSSPAKAKKKKRPSQAGLSWQCGPCSQELGRQVRNRTGKPCRECKQPRSEESAQKAQQHAQVTAAQVGMTPAQKKQANAKRGAAKYNASAKGAAARQRQKTPARRAKQKEYRDREEVKERNRAQVKRYQFGVKLFVIALRLAVSAAFGLCLRCGERPATDIHHTRPNDMMKDGKRRKQLNFSQAQTYPQLLAEVLRNMLADGTLLLEGLCKVCHGKEMPARSVESSSSGDDEEEESPEPPPKRRRVAPAPSLPSRVAPPPAAAASSAFAAAAAASPPRPLVRLSADAPSRPGGRSAAKATLTSLFTSGLRSASVSAASSVASASAPSTPRRDSLTSIGSASAANSADFLANAMNFVARRDRAVAAISAPAASFLPAAASVAPVAASSSSASSAAAAPPSRQTISLLTEDDEY